MIRINWLCVFFFIAIHLFIEHANGQSIPTNGIAAWYPLTENVLDSSGFGHNGTFFNGLYGKNRFAKNKDGIQLNGQNQYLHVANPFATHTLSKLSISGWIKLDSLPSNGSIATIYSKTGHATNMQLGVSSSGGLVFKWHIGLPNYFITCQTDSQQIVQNKWYNIVFTMDNYTSTFYINAKKKNTKIITELGSNSGFDTAKTPGFVNLSTLRKGQFSQGDSCPISIKPIIDSINSTQTIPSPVIVTKDSPIITILRGKVKLAGTVFPDYLFNVPSYVTGTYGAFSQIAIQIGHYGNQFSFMTKTNGAKFRLLIDGLLVTPKTISLSSSGLIVYQVITFAMAKKRIITIEGCGNIFIGSLLSNQGGYFFKVDNFTPTKAVIVGDSFTDGANADAQYIGYANLLSQQLGWDGWCSGSGGTGYATSGPIAGRFRFMDRVLQDVINNKPNVVVMAGGFNDVDFITNMGVSAYQKIVDSTIDSICHQLPTAKLISIGSFWNNNDTLALKDSVSECIERATVRNKGIFINPKGWITGTGYVDHTKGNGNADSLISADGTHPTNLGHEFLAKKLLQAYLDAINPSDTAVGKYAVGATIFGNTPSDFFPGNVDDIRLYNKTLDSTNVVSLFTENGYGIPSINEFTPSTATTGTIVTIKGKYFSEVKAVYFGGVAATNFTVVNDSVINAIVATGSSGNVQVTNWLATATLSGFVFDSAAPVSVSGTVKNPKKAIIPNVSLLINGKTIDTTDNAGLYAHSLFPSETAVIKAYKNNDLAKANGVSAIDLLLIQGHILGKNNLNSPYKLIAADVNNDGFITTIDLLLIKRLILGIDSTFKGNRLWAFVDSSYTFPNPTNPFPYKDSIVVSKPKSNLANQSFIGIKLGDVNDSWDKTQLSILTIYPPIELLYSPKPKVIGEEWHVPVKAINFKNMLAIQFTLTYNQAAFNLLKVESRYLNPDYNISSKMGAVSILWTDELLNSRSLPDSTVLFDLVFNKTSSIDTIDIAIANSITPIEAWNKNYHYQSITINKETLRLANDNTQAIDEWHVGNTATTSNGLVDVYFNAKESKKISLLVFDYLGKMVRSEVLQVQKGSSKYRFSTKGFSGKKMSGIYFIKAVGFENGSVKTIYLP